MMMGKSIGRVGVLVAAATLAMGAVGIVSAAAGTTEPEPAGTEVEAAAEPNEAAVNFQLADYIRDHVESGKTLKFVYVTNDLSSPYTAAQRVGVEAAIEQLGIDAELQGPPTGAAEDQLAVIQALIAQQQVDGIAVAAVNVDSLKPVIQQAYDAGIPFISVFTDQPDSMQLAFVGEDNRAFGEFEGQMLAEELAGQSGQVVAISVDTAAGWSTARMEGLEAGLAANPDLEFVGPINTGIEPGQMYNAIQNAMQANPDAIAIASVDCCSIVGAAKWAEQNGRSGEIVVIGTDALQQTLNYIDEGTIAFSISQDPVGQVLTALTQLRDLVADGTLPVTVYMPPIVVNADNSGTVTPEG